MEKQKYLLRMEQTLNSFPFLAIKHVIYFAC